MTETIRVRFAPAPTGYLHLGGARTALFNWLFVQNALAKGQDAKFFLRIEDTDTERSRPDLIAVIVDTLQWLGLDWDTQDEQVRLLEGSQEGIVYQSGRKDEYIKAVQILSDAGYVYGCDCMQDEVAKRNAENGGKPGYDGFCRTRQLPLSAGNVLRFRVPDEGAVEFQDVIRGEVSFACKDLEDFVVVRSNGDPLFLVANAVDDAAMGITHVIRGEDLLNVTPKVLLIRQALGYVDTPIFAHLPLIVNAQRKKLSKRRDDVSVGDYKTRGFLPEALVNYLATLGWGASDGIELRPIQEIIEQFDVAHIGKSSACFDTQKLEHFSGEYIREMPIETFISRSMPWLTGEFAVSNNWSEKDFSIEKYSAIAPFVQERVKRFDEVTGYVEFLFTSMINFEDKAKQLVLEKERQVSLTMLPAMQKAFETCTWDVSTLHEVIFDFGDSQGIKKGKAQAPIRVAITGKTVGPPLMESLVVLGREETLVRIQRLQELLGV